MKIQNVNSNKQSFKAITLRGTADEAKLLEQKLIALMPKQLFDKPFVRTVRYLENDMFIAATIPNDVRGIENSYGAVITEQRMEKLTGEAARGRFIEYTNHLIDYSRESKAISELLEEVDKPGFELSLQR